MQKRWLQSVLIFVAIIVFVILGYSVMKKYMILDEETIETAQISLALIQDEGLLRKDQL